MEQPQLAAPVLTRDPNDIPPTLTRGSEIPEDLDPLAEGVLMKHQAEWLADTSPLKLCEKGRRTGITFAEGYDATIIAALKRSEGGSNYFYIGDTKDKGREFIGYVAHFARVVAGELHQVEEFIFKDEREDGTTRDISAFRVTFASGFRVEALSSNPANIRGLQGVVCIDEAAFHRDVREVIDAVNALLIWEGRVRVISTHFGTLNPFNELVRETKSGKTPFSHHFIPFQKAIDNGLYKRVCFIKGKAWSPEAEAEWEALIRGSYGPRTAKMKQELDAIPADSEGSALSRVQIEAVMRRGIPFKRWVQPDDFKDAPDNVRQRTARDWCEAELKPVLEALDENRQHFMGEDFARNGDATDIVIAEQGADLVRRVKLVVELRNIPFDQQRDILFYVCDRIPRFSKGAVDKTGNGAYLAEKAAQRYGTRIVEVAFSVEWYRYEMPPFIEAFSDKTIELPFHEDILQDHQALQYVDGVVRVPKDFRMKGSDGLNRHGDGAVATALMWFASRQDIAEYDYEPVPLHGNTNPDSAFPDPYARDPVGHAPLGARLRGGI